LFDLLLFVGFGRTDEQFRVSSQLHHYNVSH